MCWHHYGGKLSLSVICMKIFFHTQPLYKTNSAVSHLSFCNLYISSSYKQCEVSASFRESACWGETKFSPCQSSGCTNRADILSGLLVGAHIPLSEFAGVLFLACKESQRTQGLLGGEKECRL